MNLRQFAQFVAVAETHSFRRAAERLFMSQPPLSVAIAKLEDEIGLPLFERSSRGVTLTPAGEGALVAIRKCLREVDRVRGAAHAAAMGEEGSLRIGFIGSVMHGMLPELVKVFHARYPKIRLELREGTNLELLGWVESDAIDLGFVRVPTARPTGVDFRVVQHDHFVAAIPSGHALASRKTLLMRDFANQPFVGYTPSRVGGLHAAVTQVFLRADISPVLAQEAVQVATVIGLVESGLGLALVPSINAPHDTPRVVFRPIRDRARDLSIGIALAYREAGLVPAARRFIDAAG